MASREKRKRSDPGASRTNSLRRIKRTKAARVRATGLQEAADDTTAQNHVRYMRIEPKIQQPTDTSQAKSFPSQMSQPIDLTLGDEVEEIFPSFSSKAKSLQDQAEEQSHSRYPLRSKTLGTSYERFLNLTHTASARPFSHVSEKMKQERPEHHEPATRHMYMDENYDNEDDEMKPNAQPWDEQSVQKDTLNRNEGEERWTLPPVPVDRFGRRQHQREQRVSNKDGETTKGKRRMKGSVTDTWWSSTSTGIMFTIPEAMTALARPQLAKTIAYDLPTGAYLSYPVHRSYHLGAMGRYGNTRVAVHTSLPYRPSGAAKGSSHFNKPRSDYTKPYGRST